MHLVGSSTHYTLKCRDLNPDKNKNCKANVHLFTVLQHVVVMGRTMVEEMRQRYERNKERKKKVKAEGATSMSFPDTLKCACSETSGRDGMSGNCIIVF